jgi:hypothetical protein
MKSPGALPWSRPRGPVASPFGRGRRRALDGRAGARDMTAGWAAPRRSPPPCRETRAGRQPRLRPGRAGPGRGGAGHDGAIRSCSWTGPPRRSRRAGRSPSGPPRTGDRSESPRGRRTRPPSQACQSDDHEDESDRRVPLHHGGDCGARSPAGEDRVNSSGRRRAEAWPVGAPDACGCPPLCDRAGFRAPVWAAHHAAEAARRGRLLDRGPALAARSRPDSGAKAHGPASEQGRGRIRGVGDRGRRRERLGDPDELVARTCAVAHQPAAHAGASPGQAVGHEGPSRSAHPRACRRGSQTGRPPRARRPGGRPGAGSRGGYRWATAPQRWQRTSAWPNDHSRCSQL